MNNKQKAIKLAMYLKDNFNSLQNCGSYSFHKTNEAHYYLKYDGYMIGSFGFEKSCDTLYITEDTDDIEINTCIEPQQIIINDKQFSTEISLETNSKEFLSEPILNDIMKLPKENMNLSITTEYIDELLDVLNIT